MERDLLHPIDTLNKEVSMRQIEQRAAEAYREHFQEERLLTVKKEGSWADYPSGVVWAVKERGYDVPAFQGAFAGDVPLGSGLSSSAAIEAATALALDAFFHLDISRKDLAVLCR